LGGNAQLYLQVPQACRTLVNDPMNLILGDGFADADIHGAIFNANENDCQTQSFSRAGFEPRDI
jgi:hypothetical protein